MPSTFTNATAIVIPNSGAAPTSEIAVSGLAGHAISRVSVTLSNFRHDYPNDVDVLLVGPTGESLVLLSDSGGTEPVTGLTLSFADNAAAAVSSSSLASGSFRPTNSGSGDTFPAPAPAQSGAQSLSTFNGTDPNGTWRLFVVDDAGGDDGEITGGWSLTFDTSDKFVNLPPATTNITLTTDEDTAKSGTVLPTPFDPDGTPLRATLLTGPAAGHGTLSSNSNGTFTFTPASNFNGTANFSYTISPTTPQKKVLATDAFAGDEFGWAVAIDGDTAVVSRFYVDLEAFEYFEQSAVYVFIRNGSEWQQQQILELAGDSMGFGAAIAIEGNTLVVGAPATDDFAGAAYVYTRSGTTWTMDPSPLVASGTMRQEYDAFGSAVAISGDTIVIGAINDLYTYDFLGFVQFNGKGGAYVFRKVGNEWSQQVRLVPSEVAQGDHFGSSVAIDDSTIVVGTPFQDLNSTVSEAGAAYVYIESGSGWSQQAKLTPATEDRHAFDNFGNAVAIDGNTVVVGAAFFDQVGKEDAGAVFVFDRTGLTWSAPVKRTASDAAANDNFGASVAISGNTIVVGAPLDDTAGVVHGSVYSYKRNGSAFVEQKFLANSGGETDGDEFGFSSAISGDTVIIGAHYHDGGNSDTGAIYFQEIGTAVVNVTVTVNAVNDPPQFTASNPPAVPAGAVEQNFTWATQIQPGPANEAGQSLTFTVDVTATTGDLDFDIDPTVAIDPAVTTTAKLRYKSIGFTSGTATLRVTLNDGFTTTEKLFTLTVNAVPPTFQDLPADFKVFTSGSTTVAYWTLPTATDAQGNPVPVESQQIPGVTRFGIGPNIVTCTATGAEPKSFVITVVPLKTFFDDENTINDDSFTVKLTGPGQTTVILNDPDGDERGSIRYLIVEDTDAVKSTLTVGAKKGKGGDGIVSIGSLIGRSTTSSATRGLKSIRAKMSDLVGDGVNVTGLLGGIAIRHLSGGADVIAGGLATQKTSFTANTVGANSQVQVGSMLSVLSAVSCADDTLFKAAAIGKMTIKSDFKADLDIAGSVGAVTIGGSIANAFWDIRGGTGKLSAKGGLKDSYLDIDDLFTSGTFGLFSNSTLSAGTTGAISVTGIKNSPAKAFSNSYITATKVGKVTLASVETNNNGVKFGISADESIAGVIVKLPAFKYPGPVANSGDFWVEIF